MTKTKRNETKQNIRHSTDLITADDGEYESLFLLLYSNLSRMALLTCRTNRSFILYSFLSKTISIRTRQFDCLQTHLIIDNEGDFSSSASSSSRCFRMYSSTGDWLLKWARSEASTTQLNLLGVRRRKCRCWFFVSIASRAKKKNCRFNYSWCAQTHIACQLMEGKDGDFKLVFTRNREFGNDEWRFATEIRTECC